MAVLKTTTNVSTSWILVESMQPNACPICGGTVKNTQYSDTGCSFSPYENCAYRGECRNVPLSNVIRESFATLASEANDDAASRKNAQKVIGSADKNDINIPHILRKRVLMPEMFIGDYP
jgi:endogenous inhibitor of DNA gyrase (YacG/DUF329 family)